MPEEALAVLCAEEAGAHVLGERRDEVAGLEFRLAHRAREGATSGGAVLGGQRGREVGDRTAQFGVAGQHLLGVGGGGRAQPMAGGARARDGVEREEGGRQRRIGDAAGPAERPIGERFLDGTRVRRGRSFDQRAHDAAPRAGGLIDRVGEATARALAHDQAVHDDLDGVVRFGDGHEAHIMLCTT